MLVLSVLSHRGFHRQVPENTLEAFQAALEIGVDGNETDVRLSADDALVLCHDRVAPNGREIAALTREELAGALGHPVPTLAEALDLSADVLWNIEIKTPRALAPARRVLERYAASRDLLVTSFWHSAIAELGAASRLRRGLLFASRPPDAGSFLATLAAVPALDAVVWDYEVLDPQLLALSAERGIRAFAYGVASRREHESCRELGELGDLGLAGVITDFPQYLLGAT